MHRWVLLCCCFGCWLLQAVPLRASYSHQISTSDGSFSINYYRNVALHNSIASNQLIYMRVDGGAWRSLQPGSTYNGSPGHVNYSRYIGNFPFSLSPAESGNTVSALAPYTGLVEWEVNGDGVPDGGVNYYIPDVSFVFNYGGDYISTFTHLLPSVQISVTVNGEQQNAVVDSAFNQPVDTDQDGIPDTEDDDDDDDGIPDAIDVFPLDPSESSDYDGDEIGDNADPDRDNDGVVNEHDAFDRNENEHSDSDGDGIGDNQDDFDDTPVNGGTGAVANKGDGNGNPVGSTLPNQGSAGESDLGDFGAPGVLVGRDPQYFETLRGSTYTEEHIVDTAGIPGMFGEVAIETTVEGMQSLSGQWMEGIGSWNPFGSLGSPSGDMQEFTVNLANVGAVKVPFPVASENIGVFRAACLFAVLWGSVISIMRILRV